MSCGHACACAPGAPLRFGPLTREAQLRAAHAQGGVVPSMGGQSVVANGCTGQLPWHVERVSDRPPPPRLAPRPLTWDQNYVVELQKHYDSVRVVNEHAALREDVFPRQSNRVPVCNPTGQPLSRCFDPFADRCKKRPLNVAALQLREAMRASEAQTNDATRERRQQRARSVQITRAPGQREATALLVHARRNAQPAMRARLERTVTTSAPRPRSTPSARQRAAVDVPFTGTAPPTAFADSLRYVGAQVFSSC